MSASLRWLTARPSAAAWSQKASSCASRAAAPVRPRVAQARAAGTRQGIRVRECHRRRRRAARIHSCRGQGDSEAVQTGVIAGYPIVDVKVTAFDGSYHDVDSNEMAFKIAGSMGFKEGFRKAKPVLLEPIMKVEVVTPEDYYGDIVGDLNRRRGQIIGMEDSPRARWSPRRCRWPRCSILDRHALHEPGACELHDGVRQIHGSARTTWPTWS